MVDVLFSAVCVCTRSHTAYRVKRIRAMSFLIHRRCVTPPSSPFSTHPPSPATSHCHFVTIPPLATGLAQDRDALCQNERGDGVCGRREERRGGAGVFTHECVWVAGEKVGGGPELVLWGVG